MFGAVRPHRTSSNHCDEFLADLEKAPKLLQTEILPGNWRVVVMEKAEGPQLRIPVNEQVKMDLKSTVNKMHDKGYVHGDLRPQNILVLTDNTETSCPSQ